MTGYAIYRGPSRAQPETVNLPLAGAYTPGELMVSDGAELTRAVAADALNELFVLTNLEFNNQTISTAYASGDTGAAYQAVPGQTYQVRMAAGTYAVGAALTVDANGRLAAVSTDEPIVAYCKQAGTFSAGDLADAVIADRVRSDPA
ncbi:hypothetical protein [Vannielia litorea]|uniref:hypothetical protein n=1 Tax=Vannielia litorea TaxID=1217970 RepID=UPI001BD16F3C|nr:hypothetical protein [Vannielia litorea]MBS8227109.1 hypothetical protein [Vannielia litorea]